MKIIIAVTVFDEPCAVNQPPETIGTEWRRATNAFQFHLRMEMCKALKKGAVSLHTMSNLLLLRHPSPPPPPFRGLPLVGPLSHVGGGGRNTGGLELCRGQCSAIIQQSATLACCKAHPPPFPPFPPPPTRSPARRAHIANDSILLGVPFTVAGLLFCTTSDRHSNAVMSVLH